MPELVEPIPADLSAVLSRGIAGATPETPVTRTEFALVERSEGKVVAGVTASVWIGVVFVKKLWVADTRRSSGTGRRLMRAVEAEGMRRGAQTACVDTLSVQAPGFYAKLGYEEFARLGGTLAGQPVDRIWFKKNLAGTPPREEE